MNKLASTKTFDVLITWRFQGSITQIIVYVEEFLIIINIDKYRKKAFTLFYNISIRKTFMSILPTAYMFLKGIEFQKCSVYNQKGLTSSPTKFTFCSSISGSTMNESVLQKTPTTPSILIKLENIIIQKKLSTIYKNSDLQVSRSHL